MNISELDIRQISIQHATVTMDDRAHTTFSPTYGTRAILLSGQYEERPFHAGGRFPQQEPSLLARRAVVLANRIATHLRTDLELNTARHSLLLHPPATIDINGTKLGVGKEPCAATPQPKRSTSICNTDCTPPRWEPYCT